MSEPWTLTDWLSKFGSPILGILGGWITTSLKIGNRMTLLEGRVGDLAIKQKADHEKLEKEHKEKIGALSTGFNLALTSHKDDFEKDIAEVKTGLDELEKSFNQYTRASHHDFTNNEEFRRFTEDWQKQCQKIQRTLGQIEGMVQRETLTSSRRSHPDSDQSPASEGSPRTRR